MMHKRHTSLIEKLVFCVIAAVGALFILAVVKGYAANNERLIIKLSPSVKHTKESAAQQQNTYHMRTVPPAKHLLDPDLFASLRAFNSETAEEPEMYFLGEYYITGYDPFCGHCCGKTYPDGITASGVVAKIGRTIAMCKDFPFGTQIYIDGLGTYTVEDRGVGSGCIDIACNSHSDCYDITGNYNAYLITAE